MIKSKNKFPDETPLDDYEVELKAFLDKGVLVPSKNQNRLMREAKEAAKNYLARKSMTIRVNQENIQAIKLKAQQNGIPYQTLINIILDKYVKGKIKIAI